MLYIKENYSWRKWMFLWEKIGGGGEGGGGRGEKV